MSSESKPRFIPPQVRERLKIIEEKMKLVRHRLVIMSGKGGVGKSFIASNLAVALASLNLKVGLMDVDFHGPSTPKMLGLKGRKLTVTTEGIEPAVGPLGVKVMSLDFLLPSSDTPVVWRGPLKTTAIMQFISDVNWGELDFLVIDMPPGTGDEALTVAQYLPKVDGALFVTIPSEISIEVVGRSIAFAKQVGIRPTGVIENMSGFYCPKCKTLYKLLGKGTGKEIAEKYNIEFLGEIPLDPRIAEANDSGTPIILAYPESEVSKRIINISKRVHELIKSTTEQV